MVHFRGKYSNNFNKNAYLSMFFLKISLIATLKILLYKMVFYTI